MRRVEGQQQLFGEIAWYSILWASDSHIDGILEISQIQAIEGRKTGRHKRSAKVVPIDRRMRSCRKETIRIVEKCLVATETGVHALWAGQFSESYPPSLGKPRQAGRVSSLFSCASPQGACGTAADPSVGLPGAEASDRNGHSDSPTRLVTLELHPCPGARSRQGVGWLGDKLQALGWHFFTRGSHRRQYSTYTN